MNGLKKDSGAKKGSTTSTQFGMLFRALIQSAVRERYKQHFEDGGSTWWSNQTVGRPNGRPPLNECPCEAPCEVAYFGNFQSKASTNNLAEQPAKFHVYCHVQSEP